MKICTLFGLSVSIFLKTFVVKKCSIFVEVFSVGKFVNRKEAENNLKAVQILKLLI